MKTVGIIAEYNPFHNGHAYQIAKAKEITGADYCVVVMSGNFVQRGVPAFMDKFLRTKAALQNGADLVLELPLYYAASSAESFAMGAVTLLDKLGIVDFLCFGSECGDIESLSALASALSDENPTFKNKLKQLLKTGLSYPAARSQALTTSFPHLADKLSLMQEPNNILGIEYVKALKKRDSAIIPCTIARAGADYHETTLQDSFSSADAIRHSLASDKNIACIQKQIPESFYPEMASHYQKDFPILPEDVSPFLLYKLLTEANEGFTKYLDIDSDFSDRICKMLPAYTDYVSFCKLLKTKNITHTRVTRNLLHILLDMKTEDYKLFCQDDFIYYARILGFVRKSKPLLTAIKEKSGIPLISKLADAHRFISSPNGMNMLEKEIKASHFYSLLLHQKYKKPLANEYKTQIIIP